MTSLVIVDDMDPSIKYGGNWTEYPASTSNPFNRLENALFNGSLHGVSGSSGLQASFSYDFTGSAVTISGGILPASKLSNVIINCTVDGSPIQLSRTNTQVLCHQHNLSSEKHTVNVAINITDSYHGVWIDYIRFNSSAPTPAEDLDSLDFELIRWGSANITVDPIQPNYNTSLDFTFMGDSLTCLSCPFDSSPDTPAFNAMINGTFLPDTPNNIICDKPYSLGCGTHQVQINYTGDSESKNCKPVIVVGSSTCDPPNLFPCAITGCGNLTTTNAVPTSESTSSTSNPSAIPSGPSSRLSATSGHVGAIVGGVIGGLVLALLIIFILAVIRRRRSLKDNTHVEGSTAVQPDDTLMSIGNVASRRSARSSMHKSLLPVVPKQRSSIAKSFFSWRAYGDMGPQQTAQVGSDYGASPVTPRRESRFSFETRRETDQAEKDSLTP